MNKPSANSSFSSDLVGGKMEFFPSLTFQGERMDLAGVLQEHKANKPTNSLWGR
jgi:hypothetical protein